MDKVIQFAALPRKSPATDTASRLKIRVPHDETGPLVIVVPEFLATGIRRSALWAGKRPERFVIDWLTGRQD